MRSCPRTQLSVLGMTPVPQHFQQMFIPSDASAVLGWAGAPSIQASRNNVMLRPGPEVFDGNEMPPAVAKIILIDEVGSLLAGDVSQTDPPVTQHVVVILRVQLPVPRRADEKLVQVGVLPTEDDLEQVMQGSKRDLVRHQDASPDRGGNMRQTDIQLVDTFG